MQAWSAAATAVFTLVLLVVSWRQWNVGLVSAKAALKSANAARLTLLAAHRPTLALSLEYVRAEEDRNAGSRSFSGRLVIHNVSDHPCVIEWVTAYGRSGAAKPRPTPREPGPGYVDGLLALMDGRTVFQPVTLAAREKFVTSFNVYGPAEVAFEIFPDAKLPALILLMFVVDFTDSLGVRRREGVTFAAPDGDDWSAWFRPHRAGSSYVEIADLGEIASLGED